MLAVGFFGCVHSRAEEKEKSTGTELFSVNSADLNPTDSLNRISGDYESGYADKSHFYKSADHKLTNPLARRSYEEVS